MIIVCGPSRVGKTTGIRAFTSRNPEWHHVIASDILRSRARPTSGLSLGAAIDNQQLVGEEISNRQRDEKIILDGHLVIPLETGLFLVNADTFSSINVSDIIFVDNSNSQKVNQNLLMVANIEQEYSKWLAQSLRCRHRSVRANGDHCAPNGLVAALVEAQLAIKNDLSRA